jgi:hypothetical protein
MISAPEYHRCHIRDSYYTQSFAQINSEISDESEFLKLCNRVNENEKMIDFDNLLKICNCLKKFCVASRKIIQGDRYHHDS